MVTITGEVFFDVAPDNTSPFFVRANKSEIKVLGTTFNVNTYSKSTVTTLLSGSLEIRSSTETARLIPGQKAIVWNDAVIAKDSIIIAKDDTLQTVSWKKTTRVYSHVPMRDFVADIGRWYGLEIVNLDCVPANAYISASLCYNAPIEKVLAMLKRSGIRFFRAGNKITFCEPVGESTKERIKNI